MALTKQTIKFVDQLGLPAWYDVLTLGFQHGEKLPFEKVTALDISAFEGAGITHDLNKPLESKQKDWWDLVIDGGTLEHIWNVPQALENCYDLLKPKGWFVSHQLQNFSGHGFWNLSIEALYRWSCQWGMVNQRCWIYSPWTRILREVTFSSERIEILSCLHYYSLFAAQRPPNGKQVIKPYIEQAWPSQNTNLLKRWLWDTRIWRWPRVSL